MAIFLTLFVASAFAQNCIKYGAPTTLTGTLLLRDEAGYNQFIVLRLARAICTFADPKDVPYLADPSNSTIRGVKDVQANGSGDNLDSAAFRDRLNRLVGHRVVAKGDLFLAVTGYVRTDVGFRVEAVDPADASGQKALVAQKAEITVKDVDVYDVTVNAGRRLVIEALESGSKAPLVPVDQYVTHWMTGGGVLYVNCRDGYERTLTSSPEEDVFCVDGVEQCGFSAFPKKPVIFRFRCTREQ